MKIPRAVLCSLALALPLCAFAGKNEAELALTSARANLAAAERADAARYANPEFGSARDMLARAELYQGDFRRANRFVQELRAVSPEDIQRAARTYMTKVRWAYVGDPAKVTPARLLRF